MQPDLNAPVAQAQSNTANLKNIFAGQRSDVNNFTSGLSNFVNSQPTSSVLADRIGSELGLPALRTTANSLNTTFANLPSTYSAATTGHDVNSNQLSRITSQVASNMAPAMTTANNALTSGENQLNQRLGYAQQDFQNALIPFQTTGQMLGETLARETSGFTQAMGNELTAIIAKLNSGVTLLEGEKNRAQELAMSEKQFEQQKQLNTQQSQLSGSSSSNPYMSIGEGNTLIDTRTGKPVYTANKTYAPSSGGGGLANPAQGNTVTQSDGSVWQQNANGSYTRVR